MHDEQPDDTSADPLLVAFLRDRDAYCPLCKYNLRALTSPRRPECGKALLLVVGLAGAVFVRLDYLDGANDCHGRPGACHWNIVGPW